MDQIWTNILGVARRHESGSTYVRLPQGIHNMGRGAY
jgi:hypothetical protein